MTKADRVPRPRGGAPQAFERLLRLAVPEAARRSAIVDAALRASGRVDLPTDPEELIDLVRLHVAPRLGTEKRSGSLADTILADLATALRGGATSAAANAPTISMPAVTPTQSGAHATPRFRDIAPSHSGAQVRVRLDVPAKPAGPVVSATRTVAFVVHRDRVLRAPRARALLSAQFDVEACDDVVELVPMLKGRGEPAIIVLELAAVSPESLRSIVEAADELLVIALSSERESASETLQRAGFQSFIVAAPEVPPAELASEARTWIAGLDRRNESARHRGTTPQ